LGAPDSGSPLVRLLGEWNAVDAEASRMDFAERVSQWLNAFDAIGLQAAHQAIHGMEAAPSGRGAAVRGASPGTLAEDVQRVRGVLARAIAQPIPAANDSGGGFAPYRDRHLELQRQMQLMIAPLRAHVRETAGRRSARLRQLAVLDTAMEHMLARREQELLPTLPSLLKRRFEQRNASALGDEDDGLQAFGREWRQALMAELEIRLAPVAGLLEAAANEWNET
jgi:hypothetical protein